VRRALPSLALLATLASAGAVRAEEPLPAAQSEALLEEAWTARLSEATARRDATAARLAADEAALTSARHRKYPRGDTLGTLERNLERSRAEHAAAEQALPELLEEARKAGVSPALLRRFEGE
jgi:hypothetical protein